MNNAEYETELWALLQPRFEKRIIKVVPTVDGSAHLIFEDESTEYVHWSTFT